MTAQSSPTIIDEAPSVVASVERIDAWLETARENDRFLYATRAMLPVGSRGAARMRDLAARGLVELQRRRAAFDSTLWNYEARRTAKPTALSRMGRPVLAAAVVDAEAALVDALLPLLSRAAKFGRPCPTDAQLAERAMLPRDDVAPALEVLRAAGLIHVQSMPAPTLRRVTILATGERTGLAA